MTSEQIKQELVNALAAVAQAQALLGTARAHLSSKDRPTQRRVDECYDVAKMESQHLDAVLEQINKVIQFVG